MNRKISTLPDVAVLGDLLGTQPMALDDLVELKTKQVTLALLRRALFAAGTGYTASDALQAGNTTITGTLDVSGAATVGGTLAVTGALTVGRIAGSSLALGTDASGTDAAATSVTQTAPLSTGNATPAALVWQVGVQGSPGTDPQTLTEGFRVQEVANASGREVALWNPSGPVMGGLPVDANANLLIATGGRFGDSVDIVRAGGGTSAATLRGTTVQGTLQNPLATASGDRLLTVSGAGWDGAQRRTTGQIFFRAIEAWTPTALGTEIVFAPVRVGTQGVLSGIRMRSDASGVLNMICDQGTWRLVPSGSGQLRNPTDTATILEWNATGIGEYGAAPVAKPTITGSRGGNVALANLLAAFALRGSLTDATTP